MRKIMLSGLLGLLVAVVAAPNVYAQFVRSDELPAQPARFSCSVNGQAASLAQCQAVPSDSAASYYITDMVVQSTTSTAGTFAVQSGTGSNCGTGTTAVFPSSGTSHRWGVPANTAAPLVVRFGTPIKVTAGHAICLIGVATNTISIQLNGYRAK